MGRTSHRSLPGWALPLRDTGLLLAVSLVLFAGATAVGQKTRPATVRPPSAAPARSPPVRSRSAPFETETRPPFPGAHSAALAASMVTSASLPNLSARLVLRPCPPQPAMVRRQPEKLISESLSAAFSATFSMVISPPVAFRPRLAPVRQSRIATEPAFTLS